jgi:hypothetical protein
MTKSRPICCLSWPHESAIADTEIERIKAEWKANFEQDWGPLLILGFGMELTVYDDDEKEEWE